ncbi:MAG: alanine--tRNA ligase [Elusimicrobiaceae bacterium]|nr:alanine--tRNA ligase [Elusimicrobiaceae bacterium]
MKGKDIRSGFTDFFKRKNHPVLPSSPLIPHGDPSLLFTSAGMVPLKPYFLGLKKELARAASVQKCFRTTDIERVGTTIRHLTFFEMLGNFSFGDYFKEDAIAYAWEFLTKDMGLPGDRLYVTVFDGKSAPKDEEAENIWKKVIPASLHAGRIKFLGDKDNFWTMGPTGPCGPCSEIYYDFGPDMSPHENCQGVGCDCDRFVEIWNLVFTQFDRKEDGSLALLPRRNIDTGMGLERLTTVMQGKRSPFATDLFAPISDYAASILNTSPDRDDVSRLAMRVTADHSRAASFLIAEGITPSNEGRGYVLRRIIRRTVRYGKLLGRQDPFMHELVKPVDELFGGIYPEIRKNAAYAAETIRAEEERFMETLESGERRLTELLEKYPGEIPGEEAFNLYETYGFPLELTVEIAQSKGRRCDRTGFETARAKAQELAKSGWKGSGSGESFSLQSAEEKFRETPFTGYYGALRANVSLSGLLDTTGKPVELLAAGECGYAVLDTTPFYAESGGQVGDTGFLFDAAGKLAARIVDTRKPIGKVIYHHIETVKALKSGSAVIAEVNRTNRTAIAANHTAVHVVNAALRQVFGKSVHQAGSYVSAQRFRFDYTINRAPSREEMAQVEAVANNAIAMDYSIYKDERPLSDAELLGAVTLVGEKYSDPARFILINEEGWDDAPHHYSLELCGGTHADRTSQLITLKIIKDSALSSGVRRIEGVAGPAAVEHFRRIAETAEKTARALLVGPEELDARVEQLVAREKEQRAEIARLKHKLAAGQSDCASREFTVTGGLKLVWSNITEADADSLRAVADRLRTASSATIAFVTAPGEGRYAFALGLSDDLKGRLDAGKLVRKWGALVGARGGGRNDFAQGGGENPDNLAAYALKLAELAGERN